MSAAAHALISASSSGRWLHCTPAPRLEERLPEKTTDYAEARRLAHEVAELKTRKRFVEPMGLRTHAKRTKESSKQAFKREENL